ncbi:MAG: membrane-bound lytic murein transglycosylase MltF [Magnetococcus sp. DMHC-6]
MKNRIVYFFLFISFLLLFAGCDLRLQRPVVENIRKRGEIRVLTRNAPTTYYEGQDQEFLGFEHDLVVAFARYLGVTPRFILYRNGAEILEALRRGEGDLAAAGLSRPQDLSPWFRFGPVYQEVDQQVVCRRGGKRPYNIMQLAHINLVVESGSSYELRLKELQTLVPKLTWKAEENLSIEQILESVWKGEIDCTLADSHVVAMNRRYYPELVVTFPINAAQSLAWVLPKRASLLQQELNSWFASVEKNGQLAHLFEHYFGYLESSHHDYDYVDLKRFQARVIDRLPELREWFEQAGSRYNTSWKLLAAQAYQESHWNTDSISGTGVRGIMMLTQPTAEGIGIKNRTDPKESILGGAWYLANLRRRLPSEIKEPDRTWIALAAYNVGFGHILDARQLAKSLGKNPDVWWDLKDVLPLLSNEKYYKNLTRGYARGSEPTIYVQKIRYYYDLLEQMEEKKIAKIIN